MRLWGFPAGSVVKNLPANAGYVRDVGSTHWPRRPPGVGNGSPLQCSCWGNPMDRGAWCYSPWSPKESNMSTKQGQEKALLFSCLYIFNFHLGLSGFLYLFFSLFPEYAFFHSVLHFLSLPAFQWLTVSTHCF